MDQHGSLSTKKNRLRKARHYEMCSGFCVFHRPCGTLGISVRFVARHGLPTDIYSDCKTNFVRAAKKLIVYNPMCRDKLSVLIVSGILTHRPPHILEVSGTLLFAQPDH